jgi:hypothetical protein
VNKDRLYLESIRECLERIEEYAAADEDAFMNSLMILALLGGGNRLIDMELTPSIGKI